MKYKDNLRAKSKVNHIEGEKIEAVAEIYWYPDYPKDDIAKLSKNKDLDDLLSKSIEFENLISSQIKFLLDAWTEQAEFTSVFQKAKRVREANEKLANLVSDSPYNFWQKQKKYGDTIEYIFNQTYYFDLKVSETEDYCFKKGERTKVWFVSYCLSTNNPLGKECVSSDEIIQRVNRKKFTDKTEMEKYVDGRKQYFSRYFTEVRPPILRDHIGPFLCCGILLDGYTIVEKL